jgi:hypothetical protein
MENDYFLPVIVRRYQWAQKPQYILKMQVAGFSKIAVKHNRLHGIKTQKRPPEAVGHPSASIIVPCNVRRPTWRMFTQRRFK